MSMTMMVVVVSDAMVMATKAMMVVMMTVTMPGHYLPDSHESSTRDKRSNWQKRTPLNKENFRKAEIG
tara:strand:- start:292 stop:495 length:204 start_codon:yes stop_codon:yes gene_type:complete